MHPTRRRMVQLGLTALAASASSLRAQPASWPQRAVSFVTPFAPGGGVDVAARLMADQLQRLWAGVPAVVENRSGANTLIAANAVLNAPRDGHTFLATIGLTMQLPALMGKVPFAPMTDFIPVGAITTEQLFLVTNAQTNIKSVQSLRDAVKANPKGFAYGSFGIGSVSHLVYAQLNKALNADIVHVPYRGSAPAVQALLSGDVALALSNLGTVKQHFASGKLVPIAVSGAARHKLYPDIPTLDEIGITGFDLPSWIGVFAPRGTPPAIVQKLSADMRQALQAPSLQAKIIEFGQEPGQMSVEEFQAMVKKDDENSTRLIRAYNVRLE